MQFQFDIPDVPERFQRPRPKKRSIEIKRKRADSSLESPDKAAVEQEVKPVKEYSSPITANEIGSEDNISLEFSRENVLRGIIYSEILGKPKSKKR